MHTARSARSEPRQRRVSFSVALDSATAAEIDAIAASYGVPRSQIVRWAVRDYLAARAPKKKLRVVTE